jgi:hypothetical protein
VIWRKSSEGGAGIREREEKGRGWLKRPALHVGRKREEKEEAGLKDQRYM